MVVYKLLLKADLENVESVVASDDTRWYIKWSCNNCGEKTENFVYVSKHESRENPKGRGSANLLYTCKFCKRDSSVDVVKGSEKPYSKSGSYAGPVVEFDCRGITPEEYEPKVGWVVRCESGTEFEDGVDFADDWVDYDDKANNSVGVYGVSGKFERA
eukprot:TRINITY_DN2447_c0_g1_i1.p1 TRINITY_DN2447_c0_g1~~TRINITY_DN2447_c0_g1_i1.p1  ORF type:complete len:158 (-),score=32.75 TRINITY_DN2447_c0_g1_i1:73-546(-)